MATMTFQINDASTSGGYPAVWVTITENIDGTLTFVVTQEGGIIGDLRGIFFDLDDEGLIGSLTVDAGTELKQGNDNVKDLGDGANMNGLLSTAEGDGSKGYDVGVEIGTSGIGKDDYQSFTFTLDSSIRDLTLTDVSGVDFGVRLTSVGVIDGSRSDSSKIIENTADAVIADDDKVSVLEDNTTNGNVFSNDSLGSDCEVICDQATGTTTITSLSNEAGTNVYALGGAVTLQSEGDDIGTFQLNSDGSYVVDATGADELSAGEQIFYTFTYEVKNQTDETSWSTDTATVKVVVTGTNDGPDAQDDAAGSVTEGATLTGNVTTNDSDVDRYDTHTYTLTEEWSGPGTLTFNADGTWSYNSGDLSDLDDGQTSNLSFTYTMTDNHGATDTATVNFTVNGVGGGGGDNNSGTGGGDDAIYTADDSYPDFAKDISHAVLVFDTTSGDSNGDGYYTVKIDGYTGETDLDNDIDAILAWLVENDDNIDTSTALLGAQIKGGSVGGADDSYDDYWANDGDNAYDMDDVLTTKKNDGDATVTAWVSEDEVPVDMSQDFQKQVDTTYLYDQVLL